MLSLLCVCTNWSAPAISTWSHRDCKDPRIATSFLQTAGQMRAALLTLFLRETPVHTLTSSSVNLKKKLNFKAHVGKQALLLFHLGVPWDKCGLTLQGVETTQKQGIINVVKTE